MITAWQPLVMLVTVPLYEPPKRKWIQTTVIYDFSQFCGLTGLDWA